MIHLLAKSKHRYALPNFVSPLIRYDAVCLPDCWSAQWYILENRLKISSRVIDGTTKQEKANCKRIQ